MRKQSLFLYLICLPLLSLGQIFPQLGAQRAGISALTFLKMDVSPRAAALGGAGICLTGDSYSAHTNPATMAEREHFYLASSNTFWVADINFAYLNAGFSTDIGQFAVSLSGLNSGRMPVRTSFQPEGTGEFFYANYLTAGISYAKRLTDQFSWGVNGRFVQERLASFVANTAVVDLGFLYNTDIKDLRFAVTVQNFGPNSTLKGTLERDSTFFPDPLNLEAYPAPTVFKLGISIIPWKSLDEQQSITTFVQLNHPNDNAENIRIGMEYAYRDLLYLRAGYKFNIDDQNYPTAGLGVRMRVGRHPLILDYGFDPLRFLGAVHRVGLQFHFNSDSRGE